MGFFFDILDFLCDFFFFFFFVFQAFFELSVYLIKLFSFGKIFSNFFSCTEKKELVLSGFSALTANSLINFAGAIMCLCLALYFVPRSKIGDSLCHCI